MGEIVFKLTIPNEWDEDLRKALERKLIVDVIEELEKRIEEARKFEEIIKKIKITDKEEAEKLKKEVAREVAKYYGVI